MAINPERAAAREIARVLRFPAAMKVESFSKGRLELVEYRLPADSALDGLALADGPERAAQAAREYFSFGSNMRASAQYRRHLAGVLAARAVRRLQEVNP